MATWINSLTYENQDSRWITICLETGVYFTKDPKDPRAILLFRRKTPMKIMADYSALQLLVNAADFQKVKGKT